MSTEDAFDPGHPITAGELIEDVDGAPVPHELQPQGEAVASVTAETTDGLEMIGLPQQRKPGEGSVRRKMLVELARADGQAWRVGHLDWDDYVIALNFDWSMAEQMYGKLADVALADHEARLEDDARLRTALAATEARAEVMEQMLADARTDCGARSQDADRARRRANAAEGELREVRDQIARWIDDAPPGSPGLDLLQQIIAPSTVALDEQRRGHCICDRIGKGAAYHTRECEAAMAAEVTQ